MPSRQEHRKARTCQSAGLSRYNRPGLTYRHGFDPRRRNQEEEPYEWHIPPLRTPPSPLRPLICADQLPDHGRLPPDPLPRPRRNQPQPLPVGQRRRHRRPLPQRGMRLRRHRHGHRDPLRDLHQPQAIRHHHHGGHQDGEHQTNTGIRAPSPGPPPLRTSPLAPLSPHSQLIQTPRPAVACRPSTVAARATPARGSALDRRRTPAPGLPWRRRGDRHGGIAGRMDHLLAKPAGPQLRAARLRRQRRNARRRPRPHQADLRQRPGCRHRPWMPAPRERGRSGGRRRGPGRLPSPGCQEPRSCSRNPGHLRHGLRHHRQMAGNVAGHPGMG